MEVQLCYTTSHLASCLCYFLNWYSMKMFKTTSNKWDISTYHMFFFSEFSIKKHEIFQSKTAKTELNIEAKTKIKNALIAI